LSNILLKLIKNNNNNNKTTVEIDILTTFLITLAAKTIIKFA